MIIQRVYRYVLKNVFGIEEIRSKIYTVFCWVLTFNFINISWVFFRSENVSGAVDLIKSMVGINGVVLPDMFKRFIHIDFVQFLNNPFFYIAPTFLDAMKLFAYLFCFAPFIFYKKNSYQLSKDPSISLLCFISFLFWYAMIRIGITPFQEFLYFTF